MGRRVVVVLGVVAWVVWFLGAARAQAARSTSAAEQTSGAPAPLSADRVPAQAPGSAKPDPAAQDRQKPPAAGQAGLSSDPQKPPTVEEHVTVTATKTETLADRLPVTAYAVGARSLEAQPVPYMNNFGEAIRDVPGVHVAQYYPWGPPWVHLRGTGYFIGRTAFLVDGLPVSPFLSQTMANADLARIDVLLGPSSALHGANASGGAVNIVTRSGLDQPSGATLRWSQGTFGTARPHASVGGTAGRFHYYLSYTGDYSDGYQMIPVDGMVDLYRRGKTQYLWNASLDPNRYRYTYATGKVGWRGARGLDIVVSYHHQRLFLSGGQPDMVLNDHGTQGIASVRLATPLPGGMRLTVSAGRQDFDRPQTNVKGLALTGGAVTLDTTPTTRSEWTMWRMPMEVQVDRLWFGRHLVTAGVFWGREHETRADYARLSGVRTSRSDYTTDQIALYVQDQTTFLKDRLMVLAGARWDAWRFFDIYDQASSPDRPPAIEKHHATFRAGAKYRVTDRLAVRSSVGTAFWPGTALWFFRNVTSGMTWREANPALRPERTWMVDVGAELDLPATGTKLGITPYVGRIADMVSYRYDVNPAVQGGTIIRSLNLGQAAIAGVELLAEQRLSRALTARASITLNRSRLRESGANTDHQLRNAPDAFGTIALTYTRPTWVNAQATWRFSSDRYYDDENTDLPYFHMEAYRTLDLKLWRTFALSPKLSVTGALSGVNLFDARYATEIVYVHPGRTVQADLTFGVRFK